METLRRELPEREPGEFAHAVKRLAEVFGTIQGTVARELVAERSGGAADDPVTGLPGPVQLDEWLRILLAEQRRYGHGFALALIDIDGLGRINDAYGRESGDRMLVAVAAILRLQLRDVDQAFRLEEDEFAIVAPHTDAAGMVAIATRIAGLISGSQSAAGPRIAIAAGVVELSRRRPQRRTAAGERRRGHLRREGRGRTRRPQPDGDRRALARSIAQRCENLVRAARTC